MKLPLALLVFLLIALNSISTLILHNEIVTETNERPSIFQPNDKAAVVKNEQDQPENSKKEEADEIKANIVIQDDLPKSPLSPVTPPPASSNDQDRTDALHASLPINLPQQQQQQQQQILIATAAAAPSSSLPPVNNNQSAPVESGDQTAASSTPNKTQAEIVRAAGAVVVNKAEMQSFEEWKEMKLKNSESEASVGDNGHGQSSSSSTAGNGHHQHNNHHHQQQQIGSDGLGGDVSSVDLSSAAVQRRKNYASAECGAKIIASNPESNKPSNILSENKDDYMLNSCANRIWFVIELCEPVRITELELANFELFSNVPRQFRVYASERYVASSPTSNWQQKYLIGSFEASNARSVQKFSIKEGFKSGDNGNAGGSSAATATATANGSGGSGNGAAGGSVEAANGQQAPSGNGNSNGNNSNNSSSIEQPLVVPSRQPAAILMYAKYVRFEMISHYGNEHYCPLSLVRIFGTSISDEEEAASPDSSEPILLGSGSSIDLPITSSATSTPHSVDGGGGDQNKDEKKSSSGGGSDFLNRLVNEKAKLLSNIIATFLGENFNLSKLFKLFSFNEQKTNEKSPEESSLTSASTSSTSESSGQSSSSGLEEEESIRNLDVLKFDRRNRMLQIDLHKVLCFSSIRNSSDCCQCLPEEIDLSSSSSSSGGGKSRRRTNKKTRSSSRSSRQGRAMRASALVTPRPNDFLGLHQATAAVNSSNNWMSKYCGYYFLMMTSAQAQLNTSFLFKLLDNIMYSNDLGNMGGGSSDENLAHFNVTNVGNYTRFSLNNINYYILNEWLDNQTAAASLYLSTKTTLVDSLVVDQVSSSSTTDNDKSQDNDKKLSLDQSAQVGVDTQIAPSPRENDSKSASSANNNNNNNNNNNEEATATTSKSETIPPEAVNHQNSQNQDELATVLPEPSVSTSATIENTNSNNENNTPSQQQQQQQSSESSTGPVEPQPAGETTSENDANTSSSSTTSTSTSTIPSTVSSSSGSTTTPIVSVTQVPTVVTPVIIGNGKDAVLMRLSNRVKILELNMTLSSQYLEKLSQHYRKQMDEMQRAFNVTTSALLETMRIADERDVKQNERIGSIERRVERMQKSMEALESLLGELKFQTDILIWTIIFIMTIIILVEVLRWLANNLKSASSSSKGSLKESLGTHPTPSHSVSVALTSAEIEALIEERLKTARDNMRLEMDAYKQGLVDAINSSSSSSSSSTSAPSNCTRTTPIDTLGLISSTSNSNVQSLASAAELVGSQPQQRAAAAAAVVSSTLATVVALAAATAQCSNHPLNTPQTSEEKT